MNILFKIFTMCGGLAFFLYGMNTMSSGLRKMAGGTLEQMLKKVTANPLAGMGLGAIITIAIQSSSAMTVMLVGLVNSGIMTFDQTISIILGSSIGTTVTNWITAMSGMKGSGVLAALKPENFSPVVAVIGIYFIMVSKSNKKKDIGKILIGFSILMYGMILMSDSVSSLKDSPKFSSILLAFENPILGLLIGAVFTGIIQSSAASISIIQALSATGQITFSMAFPLVLGANIGTCVTALISSIGVNRDAKRVSVIHIAMKVIGATICLALFYGINQIIPMPFMAESVSRFGIAFTHTAFNVLNTILLFPFSKQLVKLVQVIVPDDATVQDCVFLDERLLGTVSVAVSETNNMTNKMAQLARDTVINAISLCSVYNETLANRVLEQEDELDMYEDKLGSFLVKLSTHSLSDRDNRQVSRMLHTIVDFERLGDHAVNILKSAQEMSEKSIHFSPEAAEEMTILTNALSEVLDTTIDSFCQEDIKQSHNVEPLEQVIDQIISQIKNAHIERLQAGKCTIQTGFVLNDLLNNFSRISDHCSNIAVALIETSGDTFETHAYLTDIKSGNDAYYKKLFNEYSEKYHI